MYRVTLFAQKQGTHLLLCLAMSPLSSFVNSTFICLRKTSSSYPKYKQSGGATLVRVSASHPQIRGMSNSTCHPCVYRDWIRDECLPQNGPRRLSPGISAGIVGAEGRCRAPLLVNKKQWECHSGNASSS